MTDDDVPTGRPEIGDYYFAPGEFWKGAIQVFAAGLCAGLGIAVSWWFFFLAGLLLTVTFRPQVGIAFIEHPNKAHRVGGPTDDLR